jgi:hypothetical protein
VGEDALELGYLVSELRVARFRLLRHPLEALLDVVAIGDEQLELQALEIDVRVGASREAVRNRHESVDAAQVPEQPRPRSRHVDHPRGGLRHLRRGDHLGDPVEPLVADRRHPDVLLAEVWPDPGAREHVEERGLPCRRKADNSCL